VRPPAAERGGLLFAAFDTGRNTDARFDSDSGADTGTDIDLEDDLGLEQQMTVGRLSGYVWITRRHRIDFSLFDLSREASKTLDKDVVFGDEVFTIDTDVDTVNKLKIYKVDYTFVPLSRDRGFLGIVAGLYVARAGVSVSEAAQGTAESRALTAPLPVFGFAIGVAYNDVSMKVSAEERAGFHGRLDAGYAGALLYFKVDFDGAR